MINTETFEDLWDYFLANPWEYLDRSNLGNTKTLYYGKLNGYSYNEVWRAFDEFINNPNARKLPLIQSVIHVIESAKSARGYKGARKHTSLDMRLRRIFKRMVRQSKYIISTYGNDRLKLVKLGIKYENLKLKLKKKKPIYFIKDYDGADIYVVNDELKIVNTNKKEKHLALRDTRQAMEAKAIAYKGGTASKKAPTDSFKEYKYV